MLGQAWQSIFQLPQISVIMGCLIPISYIVGNFWYKAQKARHDDLLKRSMIERGMSAEDIERVLAAGQE